MTDVCTVSCCTSCTSCTSFSVNPLMRVSFLLFFYVAVEMIYIPHCDTTQCWRALLFLLVATNNVHVSTHTKQTQIYVHSSLLGQVFFRGDHLMINSHTDTETLYVCKGAFRQRDKNDKVILLHVTLCEICVKLYAVNLSRAAPLLVD